MDKQEIIKLTVEVVQEYNQKQQRENIKKRHEWKLKNTKLLLDHYNYFNEHIDESIYSSDQLQTIDILAEIEDCRSSIDIRAIKNSAQKTYVIMAHIDKMLSLYQTWCDKEGEIEQRKFRVLKMFYFDKLKVSDILQVEFISEKTFYRDIADSVNRLSSLIFGIDAVHQMTE